MAHIVIIGAGHNGLVCANYLLRAGHTVSMFEQHSRIGGAAHTDTETFPGYKISSCSYVCSLFLNKIVEDLNLRKYGYEVLNRGPSFFKPLPDKRFLSLGSDSDENAREISQFSRHDADIFPRYESEMGELGAFFEAFLTETPPALPPRSGEDIQKWFRICMRTARLGPRLQRHIVKLFTVPDADAFLSGWFESDIMRSACLPDSAIGAMEFSTLLLILHQSMGYATGQQGTWGYHRAGMGGISRALLRAAEDHGGIQIETRAGVGSVLFDKHDVVCGVQLKNGRKVHADMVVSNATPHETFSWMVPKYVIPWRYADRILNADYSSGAMKVNAILSGLPEFYALKNVLNPEDYIKGTIHLSPTTEYIKKALDDVRLEGIASREPMIELTIPSIVDETLAPPGHHVVNMFVQFTPYYVGDINCPWSEDVKDVKELYFRENIMPVLRSFISNIDDILIDKQILSPVDLYKEFRLTGGNIFHGAMTPGQLFCFRPSYKTPIENLWLCGAGTHPGGGVMGACGYNAAHEIINSFL